MFYSFLEVSHFYSFLLTNGKPAKNVESYKQTYNDLLIFAVNGDQNPVTIAEFPQVPFPLYRAFPYVIRQIGASLCTNSRGRLYFKRIKSYHRRKINVKNTQFYKIR